MGIGRSTFYDMPDTRARDLTVIAAFFRAPFRNSISSACRPTMRSSAVGTLSGHGFHPLKAQLTLSNH
jgi:hypothetical protein